MTSSGSGSSYVIGKAVVTEDDDWDPRVAGKWAIVRLTRASKHRPDATSYYVELALTCMMDAEAHFDEVAEAFAKLTNVTATSA